MPRKKESKKKKSQPIESPPNILPYDPNSIFDKVGIDTITIYILESSLLLDPEKYKPYKVWDKELNRTERLRKPVEGVHVLRKEYGNGKCIFYFTFSVSAMKNTLNVFPYYNPDYRLIIKRLMEILSGVGIRLRQSEDEDTFKIARIDLFKNIRVSDSFHKYGSVLSYLKAPYLKFRQFQSAPYFINSENKIYFYGKDEEIYQKQAIKMPDQILRCEMRLIGEDKIHDVLGIVRVIDLRMVRLSDFFDERISNLTKQITEFSYKIRSKNFESELKNYYSTIEKARNPKRVALQSSRIYEIYTSKKRAKFIKSALKLLRIKTKAKSSEAQRKARERLMEKYSNLYVIANLIKNEIQLNGHVIAEIKNAFTYKGEKFSKPYDKADYIELRKGLFLPKSAFDGFE
ncbi:hypothetical protein [Leptospira interrogans]|uniref:hypothetical protein n=1 Tax=Leptospira interrogans TaxID=173 RepID=UPI000377D7D7|nr:hypothetical protein [Leptospira interrogans]QCO33444.1 hypothetical protein E4414_10400 [Leptospira interrogans]UMQ55826.1 hypothetical protein FH582_10260 [Leptospira interrogans]